MYLLYRRECETKLDFQEHYSLLLLNDEEIAKSLGIGKIEKFIELKKLRS